MEGFGHLFQVHIGESICIGCDFSHLCAPAASGRNFPVAGFAQYALHQAELVEFYGKMRRMQPLKVLRNVTQLVVKFAAGEVVARLCTLALYAFTTREFGVAIFGIVALAQTVSAYVTVVADQGFKLIGARIVARNPQFGNEVIRIIVPRRAISACVAALGGCAYAIWGPLPPEARPVVAIFALGVIPASFALDWILWGTGSYLALSGWKALVGIVSAGLAIGGMLLISHPLWVIPIANVAGAMTGAVVLWLFVNSTFIKDHPKQDHTQISEIRDELHTSKVVKLGTANILNLVFTNSDLLILAAIATTSEVGSYGAATRLLFVIFSAYYLLLNTLFPLFARVKDNHTLKRYVFLCLVLFLIFGGAAASVLSHYSAQVLALLYGPNTHAARLLHIVAFALPFDLGTALMGIVLASQGYESILLRCLAIAAAVNVALNIVFIPQYRAIAASWSTVASYCVLWLLLAFSLFRIKSRESLLVNTQVEA